MSSEDNSTDENIKDIIHVSGMYENWFLDYASYVILERAVPHIFDGFKPVQRRNLHVKTCAECRMHFTSGNTSSPPAFLGDRDVLRLPVVRLSPQASLAAGGLCWLPHGGRRHGRLGQELSPQIFSGLIARRLQPMVPDLGQSTGTDFLLSLQRSS